MPIRIVRPGQTFTTTIEGVTFALRKESLARRQELHEQWLGQAGQPARYLLLGLARLEEALVGWTGVECDGQPVPFERALIGGLPDSVRAQLLEALNEGPSPLAPPSMPTSPTSSGMPAGERPTAG